MAIVSKTYSIIIIIWINIYVFINCWIPDIEPKLRFKYNQEYYIHRFYGNLTDYFTVLDYDDRTILIGARNTVYNLSLSDLRENERQRIKWSSSEPHRQLCTLKGKSETDCQNYIRVFGRVSDKQIMLCGTNSFKPLCRYYNILMGGGGGAGGVVNGQIPSSIIESSTLIDGMAPMTATTDDSIKTVVATNSNTITINTTKIEHHDHHNAIDALDQIYENVKEIEAQGRCPYNPMHNSTYVFTDGQLYSATVADFSGADPLIYRETQRTEQYDLKQLNQPAFVSALERNGYVLFFFREIAMETMACGKSIYSRVGRVCKNDKGGPYPFNDRWTSFLKARLNCSIPDEYPFYFDEIQATSQIIEGIYSILASGSQFTNNNGGGTGTGSSTVAPNSIIYTIFTTSQNAIPGSAICAFAVDDIMAAFEGRFKSSQQRTDSQNWYSTVKSSQHNNNNMNNMNNNNNNNNLNNNNANNNNNLNNIQSSTLADARPGQCVDDSRTLPPSSVNFVRTHTLMDGVVPAIFNQPLFIRVNLKHRFTAIAVDRQIKDINGIPHDVIFIGTDDGSIIKLINNHMAQPKRSPPSATATADSTQPHSTIDPEQLHAAINHQQIRATIISESQALPYGMAVTQLIISKNTNSVVVVGNGHIVSMPLYHCSKLQLCRDCLAIQDPYCVWDINNHECTTLLGGGASASAANLQNNFIQNIFGKRNIDPCKAYGGGVAGSAATSNNNPSVINGIEINGINTLTNNWPPIDDGTILTIGKSTDKQSISHTNQESNDIGGGGGPINNGIGNGNDLTNQINDMSMINLQHHQQQQQHPHHHHHQQQQPQHSSADRPLIKEKQTIINGDDDNDNNGNNLQLASSTNWILGIGLLPVFIFGLIIGFIVSKKFCKSNSFHGGGGGGGGEHRNHLTWYGGKSSRHPLQSRNSGKDVNLLMNTNAFPINNSNNNIINNNTNTNNSMNNQNTNNNNNNQQQQQQHKKDNLEQELAKDRSHESKNSAEKLEKEAACKTGTLQKVKKTYI